jgi:uncharacterized protein YdhG (YjbR/CyaY superfamily)
MTRNLKKNYGSQSNQYNMITDKPNNVDEYIAGFPGDIQKILEEVRVTIKKAAPQAEEVISYSMPAFRQNGMLVFYAAHKNHIGFYPTSSGTTVFKEELTGYNTSKGAIQFPLGKPIPLDLITKIVKFRVKENTENS